MNKLFESSIFTISGTTPAQFKKMVNTEAFDLIDLSLIKVTKISTIELSGYSIEPDNEGNIAKIERKANSSYMILSDCVEDSNVKVPCWYCREKMGTWEHAIITSIKSYKTKDNKIQFEVYRHGYFCDEICNYWYCLERKNFSAQNVRKGYEKSIEYLKLFTNRKTPLPEFKPWQILEHNGGTLKYGQWKNKAYTFKVLPGYVNHKSKCNYLIGQY